MIKVMRDRQNVRLRNCFCFRYQRLKNFLCIFLVPNERMSMTVTTTWIQRPRLIQSFTQQVTQIFSPVRRPGKHKWMIFVTVASLGWEKVTTRSATDPKKRYMKSSKLYPLVNVYITMENHHFSWENSTISTGPFSSSQTVSHYQRV